MRLVSRHGDRPDAGRRVAAPELRLGMRQEIAIEVALRCRGLDPRVVALVGDPDACLARAAALVGGPQHDHLVALERVQRHAGEDDEPHSGCDEEPAHGDALHRRRASST